MSEILSKKAYLSLVRLGNILIPGEGDLPSYSDYGGYEHIDDLLTFLPENDLRDLRFMLTSLYFIPKPLVHFIISQTYKSHSRKGQLASFFRRINSALKGLVLSTYYTELAGKNYKGNPPLDTIGYKINRI